MRNRTRRSMLGCTAAGGLILALLAVAAYQFTQHGAAVDQLAQKAAPIMVVITDPHTGQQAAAGAGLLVQAEAGGPNLLNSLELWVDGAVVGIQAAPPGPGLTSFSADFAWTPAAPGTYSLIARALDSKGQSADSNAVIVIVGESTKPGGGEGQDFGQSIPIANGGGGGGGTAQPLPVPPALPDASDSAGPAQTWSLSLGDWLMGGDDAPLDVELAAVPAGCGALLSIHDLSEGEEGFIVFRMTDSAPMMTKLATLDGQSDLEWLTYTDESYTAENSYLIRAFDGVNVSDSNIVQVEGNPEECAQPPAPPQLSIKLTSLQTGVDADNVYCYRSFNGVDWSRWPTTGFFTPGPDDFEMNETADAVLLDELNGKSLSLDLECWGWVGGALQLLGKLHRDGIGPELGVTELSDGDFLAGFDFGGPITTKDGDPPEKAPTDPEMPKVFAILFYGPDACTEHLPSGGNDAFENLLFCSWYPNYNFDNGESQPYLVWYVSDGLCVNGQGSDCNSFQSYLNRANTYGGKVGFHVYGQFADSIPLHTTPHDLTAFVVPPQTTCDEDTLFMTVRMFYQGGPTDPDYPNQMIEGPDSNTVTSVFNCPPPEEVKLDVFFDNLHIDDLGDGIAGGDDLEVYASFVAEGKNPGTGSVLNLGYWGWQGSNCPDDSFTWLGFPTFISLSSQGFDAECPTPMKEGDIPIGDLDLCSSNTYSHCVGSYAINNNKITVTVADGSTLRVAVHAMDYDDMADDDTVCQAETTLGPESIFGWDGFTGGGLLSQGDNDSASCTVSFHVSPAP